jgi:hypothetical protein
MEVYGADARPQVLDAVRDGPVRYSVLCELPANEPR